MKNRLKNINFYLTSIAIGSSIDNLVDSGTFIIKDTTVNGFSLTNGDQLFYVIVDADQSLKREIFRITHVDTGTKILTFDKRISPNGKQTHAENALVQINDFAEIFNFLALHTDDAGYVELVSGLDVNFYGGKFTYDTSVTSLPDSVMTMNPNATNYIILDFTDDLNKTVTTLPTTGHYLFATVVTNGTDVLSITDNRATYTGFDTSLITPSTSIGTTTTLAAGAPATVTNSGTALEPILNFGIPQGIPGSIAEAPVGESQTVDDNIVPDISFTVTYVDNDYIKVTQSSGAYTTYRSTGIRTYDSADNLLTAQLITGVWGATGITYASINGSVNKTTGVFTFLGNIAYTNVPNTFWSTNVFQEDTTFKGRTSFPFYNIGSVSGGFNFDATNGMEQKVTLTGSSANTCTFHNLVQGTYVFFVVQSGTGTMQFAIDPSDNGSVTSTAIINTSFTSPQTLAAGTHIYTVLVAETKAHISYTGTSI